MLGCSCGSSLGGSSNGQTIAPPTPPIFGGAAVQLSPVVLVAGFGIGVALLFKYAMR